MKRLLFVFGVLGAGLVNSAADARGCFASAAAVFAAHPNAAHASYTLRPKRPERCWYADAFKSEAKAAAKPASRPVARAARMSAPLPAIRAAAPRLRARAIGSASPGMTLPFPSGTPSSLEIAVNAKELSGLWPFEDMPADFESRFSASGYVTGHR